MFLLVYYNLLFSHTSPTFLFFQNVSNNLTILSWLELPVGILSNNHVMGFYCLSKTQAFHASLYSNNCSCYFTRTDHSWGSKGDVASPGALHHHQTGTCAALEGVLTIAFPIWRSNGESGTGGKRLLFGAAVSDVASLDPDEWCFPGEHLLYTTLYGPVRVCRGSEGESAAVAGHLGLGVSVNFYFS